MPYFMTVLLLYINLLNLSRITKCLFLRNMEPVMLKKDTAIVLNGYSRYDGISK